MLNKITLAVLGFAISGVAAAGTMGPVCTPGNVTVPCEAKQWDLGVQALYLKPTYDADRGYQQTADNQYAQLHNDWNWGYRLEGSYHFNTGNDVSLNWSHLKDNEEQYGLNGQLITITPVVANTNFEMASQNTFDQVNLEIGQLAHFGNFKDMRFYAGLQYASIQYDATHYFTGSASVFNLYDRADFRGFGPLVGIDYAYKLTSALSLTANGSTSILYGTSRYNAGYIFTTNNLNYLNRYASKKSMVPGLEAKLGLNYAHECSLGLLNLEAGYQALNYFNALPGQRFNAITTAIRDSDYGLYGPYIGIKYLGAA